MTRHTGGFAVGETSTRSSSASSAYRIASWDGYDTDLFTFVVDETYGRKRGICLLTLTCLSLIGQSSCQTVHSLVFSLFSRTIRLIHSSADSVTRIARTALSHRNRIILGFPLAHDEHIGDLHDLGIADFTVDLFVARIELDPQAPPHAYGPSTRRHSRAGRR